MAFTIMQWNCNGFERRKPQIAHLISKFSPSIMCIQETRFPALHIPKFKNYKFLFKNKLVAGNASGGVAMLIADDIDYEEIRLSTTLYAVAAKIKYPFPLSICNVYIPPRSNFDNVSLTSLISQLPKPYIILGDFNAHNAIWGSSSNDTTGNMIENVMLNPISDLVCLNNGSNTHLTLSSGTFSAIDLAFASSNVSLKLRWDVHDDLCESDHFPIFVSIPEANTKYTKRKKWLHQHADWKKFQQLAVMEPHHNSSMETIVKDITNTIVNAAKRTIPMTSDIVTRKQVPWWSSEVKTLIKNRKRALRTFKSQPTIDNFINFKKFRAQAIYGIKKAKQKSWENFVSTIETQTPYTLVWNKIRAISGNNKNAYIKSLTINNQQITNTVEISNALGRHYQNTSSSNHYSTKFLAYKTTAESSQLCVEEPNEYDMENFNSEFTFEEMNMAFGRCKGSSPGDDNITYEMI